MSNLEQTLSIIKPDAVERNLQEEIKNESNNSFQFYPYAQISRKGKIEGMQIYILHEGFLGVFGDELKEENFDDIEKEKFSINASKGWLGITDKYWLTAIVPEKGKEFKAEFVSKNKKYRANYIIKEASILNPNGTITNKIDDLEFKNSLLTNNLDLDYIEILLRQKFLLGKKDEKFYIIEKYDN